MLPIDGWIAAVTLAACLIGLARFRHSADVVMMAGLTVLLALNVVPLEQGLAGFANEGVLTIAALYVLVAGLQAAGVVDRFSGLALGRPAGLRRAMVRMFMPVAGSSAVVNNTPIVALFIPAIIEWCGRYNLPTRTFLLPLSFIAIAAGTCSLLGSATNVIANGLLLEVSENGLGLFETISVGLPLLLATAVYLCLAAPVLLRGDIQADGEAAQSVHDYAAEFIVEANSPITGRSVEQADLRHLNGVFLADIVRGTERLSAVSPDTLLQAGDRLEFVGDASRLADLQRTSGLVRGSLSELAADDSHWFEAVVSPRSGLVGKCVRESGFRGVTATVIVAIRREGQRLSRQKIGDVTLQAGDTLLLTGPRRPTSSVIAEHFLLLRDVGVYRPTSTAKSTVGAVVFVSMILAASTGLISLLVAAWLGAGAMLAARCLTPAQARRAVDLRVLVVIAASIGIGNSLTSSGIASEIASAFAAVQATDPTLAIAVIVAITCLLSAVVTNSAAVIILFPLVLPFGTAAGLGPKAVTVALIVGASASFMTAIAYQTNLMVQGVGRYSATDFIRLGGPLVLIFIIVASLVIPVAYANF